MKTIFQNVVEPLPLVFTVKLQGKPPEISDLIAVCNNCAVLGVVRVISVNDASYMVRRVEVEV